MDGFVRYRYRYRYRISNPILCLKNLQGQITGIKYRYILYGVWVLYCTGIVVVINMLWVCCYGATRDAPDTYIFCRISGQSKSRISVPDINLRRPFWRFFELIWLSLQLVRISGFSIRYPAGCPGRQIRYLTGYHKRPDIWCIPSDDILFFFLY
jgi:hypothetical protein